MIKVLIVDDSKFMRVNLERMLSSDLEFHVSGTARNGIEALDFLKTTSVDVIILDFFMPKMDGLETLTQIMKTNPTPTLMITIANKSEYADLFINALRLGAFDIITKPSGLDSLYIEDLETLLKSKIIDAAKSKQKLTVLINQNLIADQVFSKIEKKKISENSSNTATISEISDSTHINPQNYLLVIGASTGGPTRVFELVQNLRYFPNLSILIIQHMPGGFTDHFAQRLSSITEYKVLEGSNGEKLRQGLGYVAPGDFHTYLFVKNSDVFLKTDKSEKVWGLRPCIDYGMMSAAPIFKNKCIGVILTGMGKDGTEGMKRIKENGGITFAQSLDEAMIDSMPDSAIKTGCIDYILTTGQIAHQINKILSK